MVPDRSLDPNGVAPADQTAESSPLDTLLKNHLRWIESGGSEGAVATFRGIDLARADLSNRQLSHANLVKARMRGANLRGSDLEDADLTSADLLGAELSGADLRRSLVRDTNLRDTNLSNADLTGARGLLAGQLGGANLAGAKLPEEIARFDSLANVTEASKTTQNLFFSILFACTYTWLTIASTRDAQLLNNAAPPSSRLPILGTDIPLVQFYLVAPLLLVCLFIYFHLCLQRLWEELGDLPAVFPDGRTIDKRAYPWLLNVLVRIHSPRLKSMRTNLTWCQAIISVFLAWGLVPITLVVIWARYLRSHDWWVTGIQIALLSGAIGAALGFRRLATASLRGAERRPFQWKRAWRDARGRGAFVAVGSALALFLLSFGAIEGYNPTNRGVDVPETTLAGSLDPRHWIPRAFQLVGYNTFAQLDEASLSVKPASWTGGNDPKEIEMVRGADLEKRNLRYAQAWNVFGVNAFLRHADASNSDLREADLREADFREAKLRGANLRGARLQKADLRWADLTEARLKEADLTEAILDEANAAQANLQSAILRKARLTKANLRDADLRGADLTDAVMAGTQLAGADLTGALGLTPEQFADAQWDASTRWPEGLPRLSRVSDRRGSPLVTQ